MTISLERFFLVFLIFLLSLSGVKAQEVWVKKEGNIFTLNTELLNTKLKQLSVSNRRIQIIFPNLNGELVPFEIYDNAVLPPDLAKKYPQVHSFKGFSKNNTSQIIRFTCTPSGIEATLLQGNQIMNLTSLNSNKEYTLTKDEPSELIRGSFKCGAKEKGGTFMHNENSTGRSGKALIGDNKLRIVRLAVATTGEYSDFFVRKNNLQSGTEAQKKAAVLAGVSTSINAVNVAFERDLGVRFELIPNTDDLFFLDRNTDPFENNDSDNTLVNKGAEVIRNSIPFADYDLGHLLSGKGFSGLAGVGGICEDFKGDALSGFSSPEGFFFDFTLFAHELGHQLGGRHTQSADCQNETPVEVGSGTTIMGYSGACSVDNVQNESDPFFHSLSVDQIAVVLKNNELNSSCGVQISPVNNSNPSIPLLQDYVVPLGVPIYLESIATDVDGDNLTYSWEQFDVGVNFTSFVSPPVATSTIGPQFRVFSPIASPRRDFPSGGRDSKWEVLPKVERTLSFRLFVRDGKPGGIAISNLTQINIVSQGQQFRITSPSAEVAYDQNATEVIRWDVAGTDRAPFNVENVKIEYSFDGGQTYPVVLSESAPNNGEAVIKAPILPQGFSGSSSNGRIRISALQGAFYTYTKEPITLTGTVNQDFPSITMVSRQDLRVGFLIFKIKASFNAPEDINFIPRFLNADTKEDINIDGEVQVSSDRGFTYEPLGGGDLVMKAGTSELWLAVPLQNGNRSSKLSRLEVFLEIPEGSNNISVLQTGFLEEQFKNIEDNVSVSPNPSRGLVTFTALVFPKTSEYDIRVFSITGEFVSGVILSKTDQEKTLDVLAPGLYLVQISLGDIVTTKKLVVY